jgi:hypothetical protein
MCKAWECLDDGFKLARQKTAWCQIHSVVIGNAASNDCVRSVVNLVLLPFGKCIKLHNGDSGPVYVYERSLVIVFSLRSTADIPLLIISPSEYLSTEICYCSCNSPLSFQPDVGKVAGTDRGQLLPHIFQFIIHCWFTDYPNKTTI